MMPGKGRSPIQVVAWGLRTFALLAAIGPPARSQAPAPEAPPAPAQPPCDCFDPPSEAEIWAKVPLRRDDSARRYEIQREDVRFLVEKIGEKVDPWRTYPLAGSCQLVHCHYKCTVTFDEHFWPDDPALDDHVEHRREVILMDKDYLRRANGEKVAVQPPSNEAGPDMTPAGLESEPLELEPVEATASEAEVLRARAELKAAQANLEAQRAALREATLRTLNARLRLSDLECQRDLAVHRSVLEELKPSPRPAHDRAEGEVERRGRDPH